MRLNPVETKSVFIFCSAVELLARQSRNSRQVVMEKIDIADIKRELEIIQGSLDFSIEQLANDWKSFYKMDTGSRIITREEEKMFTHIFIGHIFEILISSIFESREIENSNDGLSILIRELLPLRLDDVAKRFLNDI